MSTLGASALKWCVELSGLTDTPGRVHRDYLGTAHQRACEQIEQWLDEADLVRWRDTAGNLWGRLPAEDPDAPAIIMGGYLDTQVDSGRFDGVLGVVLPLLVMRQLKSESVRLPFHLDLVGFAGDRGNRFGAPLPGSRAVAGNWDRRWSELLDPDGHSMADAFTDFELDIAQVIEADRSDGTILAYLETNVEQGPILETEALPIGIVSAIAGTRRFVIEFEGESGHAGAVPMHLRRDALAAAAEFTLIVERVARDHGVIATVGRTIAHPGIPHRIAGHTELTLDIRSEQDSERDAALNMVWETAKLACEERAIEMRWEETYVAPAVACSDRLQAGLAATIERQGLRPRYLVSGSDHDAVAMAKLCPVALLSVRCASDAHAPAEGDIGIQDADIAGRVLRDWIVHEPEALT